MQDPNSQDKAAQGLDDWHDENEDANGDNQDYRHIIGGIVNVLESMGLESM
jgi:hypothetical protein